MNPSLILLTMLYPQSGSDPRPPSTPTPSPLTMFLLDVLLAAISALA